MFDVGADCLLMSDAGDISRARVSSGGAYLICENIVIKTISNFIFELKSCFSSSDYHLVPKDGLKFYLLHNL